MILLDNPRATTTDDTGWAGFTAGPWQHGNDVRDFIQRNYTPFTDDASFLTGATDRTLALWAQLTEMFPRERALGVYDVAPTAPASITAHAPGYIDQPSETIVGLQTDAPLKRAIMLFGSWRMAATSLETYGYPVSPELESIFTKYHKTHNDGIFDVYPPAVKRARHSHLIIGLPDAYGRGLIIGDYRRVALYGVTALIAAKKLERVALDEQPSMEEIIRSREENAEQVRALKELVQMAATYGFNVARPARTATEAVQWLYFAYLGSVKEQNGAALSLGRNSAFLDIYLERDLAAGILTESQAQELIDDLVIKLIDDVLARIRRYRGVFAATGGGVTLSGGEPLMQPSFVARLFAECHELGVHTTLDTSGYLGASATDELLDNTDLVRRAAARFRARGLTMF